MEIGEISDPVKSNFGYHLIRLLNKQGEKISTQHILMMIDFSDEDRINTYNSAFEIYSSTNNNPASFDSLSSVYLKTYKNNSGKYSNFPLSRIPDFILSQLKSLNGGELSLPVEGKDGYFLVYFYTFQKGFIPDVDNSWDLIYQYAKQKKQSTTFSSLVEDIKTNTYIKVLNN